MAKDKSKDEVKADIVERDTEDVTVEAVKRTSPRAKAKIEKGATDDGTAQESDQTAAQADQEPAEEVEKPTAKAGKRSAKALKEEAEKRAKEERKSLDEAVEKPKQLQKPTRSRLERRGNNFRKVAELIDKTRQYGLAEAIELAVKTNPAKFDATVELHIRLNVDPRQADQNIRDNLVLPAGTGKTVRVTVFAEADDAAAAKKAGADFAGQEEVLAKLDKGVIDFDVLIATPKLMAQLGKYARVLGPKGLMPNPKSGTVTTDVAKAVQESKAGRVEYRVDSTGIIHLGIGKVSFGKDKLLENARAVFASVKAAKPGSVKGTYVHSIHIATAMGPSVSLQTSEL